MKKNIVRAKKKKRTAAEEASADEEWYGVTYSVVLDLSGGKTDRLQITSDTTIWKSDDRAGAMMEMSRSKIKAAAEKNTTSIMKLAPVRCI